MAALHIFVEIPEPSIAEALLPDAELSSSCLLQLMRKAALDVLHRALDGNLVGSQDEVDMIRHDDKLMQEIFLLRGISVENPQKQLGGSICLQQALPAGALGRDKVCSEVVNSRWLQINTSAAKAELLFRASTCRLKPAPSETTADLYRSTDNLLGQRFFTKANRAPCLRVSVVNLGGRFENFHFFIGILMLFSEAKRPASS